MGPGLQGRRVLVTGTGYRQHCREALELLTGSGAEVVVNDTDQPSWPRADLLRTIGGFDAVIAGLDRWDLEVLAAGAPRLRVLARFGVGVDNIDLAAAAAHGVVVVNAPGLNTNAVAEHTLALVLAAWRRLPAMDAEVRCGGWPRGLGRELAGRTVGLVGFGAIARRLVRLLAGFGVVVLAHDPVAEPAAAAQLGVDLLPLEELLGRSDVVSLHLPSTPDTFHLMDGPRFAAMRSGALLVNTSRGQVVDEQALAAELATGRLSAALDVYESEPLDAGSPLTTSASVLSPHQGGETHDAYRAIGLSTARDVVAVLSGSPPLHPVPDAGHGVGAPPDPAARAGGSGPDPEEEMS